MRFVRLLPERWQKLLHEVLKFGAVGGVNAAINYAVFISLALTVFVDGQLKANVVATVVATCSSYLMNRHWTYRDRPKSAMRRETTLFFLFNATGLAIELGVLALVKYGFGATDIFTLTVAKTVGVGVATVFRFWSYRTFVFRSGSPTPLATTSTETMVKTTTRAGSEPEPDGRLLTGLDPMAGLVEAVTELEAEDHRHRDEERTASTASTAGEVTTTAAGTRVGIAPRTGQQPLEVQFAETIDAALETELAVELNAEPRRSTAR